MCTNPIHLDPFTTVSCGICDQCITARKSDWVARCMAEKASMGHAFAITLTYRNDYLGNLPASARIFHYRHVQLFLKRLRKAYSDHYGSTGDIRYIVAGERGSKNDRVHWHMVIFSRQSISPLGEWTSIFDASEIDMPLDRDVIWSLWPHGFVHVQRPNQSGMSYVLKYALKDQFTVSKSRDSARITKADNHGAGMFRMSKKPPIAFEWLTSLLNEYAAKEAVPPSFQFRIPEMKGYWVPRGLLRNLAIERIYEINQQHLADYGRPCPQWPSLIASVSQLKSESIMEGLIYGPSEQTSEDVQDDARLFGLQLAQKQRERARAYRINKTIYRCCGHAPCEECLSGFSDDTRSRADAEAQNSFAVHKRDHPDADWRSYHNYLCSGEGGPIEANRHCICRDAPHVRTAVDAAEKARRFRFRLFGGR